MPFICKIRDDIPDGILQVLDLEPNTSQRSLIYDPPGQTKYVNAAVSESVVLAGAGPITVQADASGLAAYLIDHIENTGSAGEALTSAEADTIAAALIARVATGAAMEVADVNAVIQATVGGSGIGIGNSTATLTGILRVLAGGSYLLPAGSQVEDGGNAFDTTVSGVFVEGTYRETYDTGSLTISLGEGDLATFTDAAFVYQDLAGAACVVYADDGTLLS